MTELYTTLPLHYGDLVVVGVTVVGLVWLCYGGVIVIRLGVAAMQRHWAPLLRPQVLDEYADDVDHAMERPADSLREPRQHDRDLLAGHEADATQEIEPGDEPWWPEKASHRPEARQTWALREQAVVLGGNPARFDLTSVPAAGSLPEMPAETSGRHAKIDGDDTVTGLMPVVDDEAALAVAAAVSGQDGAR